MCFHSKQTKSAQELKHRFKAEFPNESLYKPTIYNGFQHPKTPIITNDKNKTIQMCSWGLIPPWAKNTDIQRVTLNARIETLDKKPSFKSVINNRCLILSDGFYEWQWLDKKGKEKQKYLITAPNETAFAFAGLWSQWIDKTTGEVIKSYTIITTQANHLMSKIHNTKKRMPVILNPNNENDWLMGNAINSNNMNLIATKTQ